MRNSRLFTGLLLSVVLSSILATALPAQRVHAAVTVQATFLNRYAIVLNNLAISQQEIDDGLVNQDLVPLGLNTINQYIAQQLVNAQLTDENITDGTEQYVYSNSGCDTIIKFQDDNWELIKFSIQPLSSGCKEVLPGGGAQKDLELAKRNSSGALDVTKSNVWFTRQTVNSMVRVDGKDGEFVENPVDPGKYYRVDEAGKGDQDFVELNSNTVNNTLQGGYYHQQYANRDEDIHSVLIDGAENKDKAGSTTNPLTGGNGSGSESCENNAGALGWILCPIINLFDGALNWMDARIQNLLAIDENRYADPALHQVWVQMRNLAYILLIPTMLIMVIGTALGFEVFSAYTVKKALPRMVIAVIFITFSWYICTFLITFFNVLGAGVVGIITAPFAEATGGVRELTLSSLFSGNNFAETFIGAGTVAAGIAVLIWLFLGAIVITVLAAFMVLMLRQMFIVGLILLSPFAILAWIFPGNDKPWKLWWLTFTRLLLMFPLIMGVIALGRVFAWLIMEGSAGAADAVLAPFMAVIAYVAPYAFIPFTFRLAGGFFATLTGMVNDRSKGFFDKSREKRAQKTERAGRRVLQKRANAARSIENYGNKAGFIGKRAARLGARGVGGYNMEAAMSAKTAQVAKELKDQIETGKDDSVRGLTAWHSYQKFQRLKKDVGAAEAERQAKAGLLDYVSIDDDGSRSFKSLGGQMVGETSVVEGKRRWGSDRFAQQAALSYEMKKASSAEDVQNIKDNFGGLVSDLGMTNTEAQGAWIGAGFENQNKHLEFKHTKWDAATGRLKVNGAKLASDVYENRGSYNMAQVNAATIQQLGSVYDDADAITTTGQVTKNGVTRTATADELAAAQRTKLEVTAASETFMSRYGRGAGGADGDDAAAILAAQQRGVTGAAAQQPAFQTNTPGAAHVAEEVRRLAVKTGVYQELPKDPGSTGPVPPIPNQN